MIGGDLSSLEEIEALVRASGVPATVAVGWFGSRRALGTARYRDGAFFRLEFSRHLWPLLTPEERRNNVLHESAHALRPVGEHHSAAWQELFISMGGNGQRLVRLSPEVSRAVSKWTGTCPRDPEHKVYRKMLTQRTRQRSCGECADRWTRELVYSWTENF